MVRISLWAQQGQIYPFSSGGIGEGNWSLVVDGRHLLWTTIDNNEGRRFKQSLAAAQRWPASVFVL